MIAADQPGSVQQGEEINLTALNDYLIKSSAPVGSIVEYRQFPGGYSNLTYLLSTATADYILRRPPAGAAIKSAHDMGREFKVLSLLTKYYSKIPVPILHCESPDIIGAPFYIMERLHGVILRPSFAKEIHIAADEMRRISESVVDNLAALHSLDIHRSGLIQLGKPDGYIKRQVEGWTRRYADAQTDSIAEMEELDAWLHQHQPEDSQPTLLHNDYKYDNIVLHKNCLPEIVGVLDWEMATVGDPGMDLGATLAYWAERNDSDLTKVFNISWLPGNLTRKEVLNRYSEKTGRIIDQAVFFYVFGLYKNAVIAQQIYTRWKQGHSIDPRFGQLIHVIREIARQATKSVEVNSL